MRMKILLMIVMLMMCKEGWSKRKKENRIGKMMKSGREQNEQKKVRMKKRLGEPEGWEEGEFLNMGNHKSGDP